MLHDVILTDMGAMTIGAGNDGEFQLSGDDVLLYRGDGATVFSDAFVDVDAGDVALFRGDGVTALSASLNDVDGEA